MPSTALVLELSRADRTMIDTVGGKAANLGEMLRAELPVPPGFCVTTDAYALAVTGSVLDLDAFDHVPGDDVAALSSLAGQARSAILAAPMPPAVAAAVLAEYARLGDGTPVAVRSSATAEDLPSASFAGQQDTYLNVIGGAAVVEAVARCWASLWTDRAVVYRSRNAIPHRTVRLAVVVQRMVDARCAGVLFTADPVTGRRRQAVIDASPGLGEAVVSGAVNPDHFVVDTATGAILERRLGDKKILVRALAGGGVEQVDAAGGDTACITDDQVRALAALGDRVESFYGAPQDTEWAIDDGGTLWLTQARPVTTLYPLAEPRGDGLRVYFSFSVAQGLNRPITPMGLAAFRMLGGSVARQFGFDVPDPLAGPRGFADPGQRVYVDFTGILRSRVGRTLMPRLLDVMEARSAAIMRGLFADPRLSVVHTSPLPFLRRVLRFAARHRVPVRAIRALADPDAVHREFARRPDEIRHRLSLPDTATPAERLDLVERALTAELFPLAPPALACTAPGFAMLALGGRLAGARPGELQTVLRGLPHNVTTAMDLDLWRLATVIRGDAAATALLLSTDPAQLAGQTLPAVVQDGLDDFLGRYGDRAVAEIDIGMPRWSDDPTHVLGVVANYLRLTDDRAAPDAVFARSAAEAEAAVATLVERAGPLRRPLVRFALDRARRLAGVRELPKYLMIVSLGRLRAHLTRVGAALAEAGRIDSADDIFMLTTTDARAGLAGTDLHDLVAARRSAYRSELRRRHVPRVLLSDGTEPGAVAPSVAADGALTGTPASAGTVTGIARVIMEPVGARLEPGEILVAPSTDPGWTPLFLTAGGLVMEMGGANSHGAVVAREYGIPAVVGVPDATARIRTGDRITVDGTGGFVRP